MAKTPRGERLVLTIIGKRNAGKSSLINALTGQNISIVSDIPGTTTDPVAKAYELIPIGPVTIYDTAGIDDSGELGEQRVKKTKKVLFKTDVAIIVTEDTTFDEELNKMITDLSEMKIPFVIAFNKNDKNILPDKTKKICEERKLSYVSVSGITGSGMGELKEKLIGMEHSKITNENKLLVDLLKPNDLVVLIVPIDLSAPKGRIILPQVQVIREILDAHAIAIIAKDSELEETLKNLDRKPDLAITDSQVVGTVQHIVPQDVPFTTFSTLFARYKGDFVAQVEGARAIDRLKDGSRILIAEACSHHTQEDDIGTVKIPKWMKEYTKKELIFEKYAGNDFPENLEDYDLVIHCGACMLNQMEMKRRIIECNRRGVPITNYGVTISKLHGQLERVVKPILG